MSEYSILKTYNIYGSGNFYIFIHAINLKVKKNFLKQCRKQLFFSNKIFMAKSRAKHRLNTQKNYGKKENNLNVWTYETTYEKKH